MFGAKPKASFRPYQTPEPQPWGAVTRRAVAQRRSRASGLTRPSAEAIRAVWFGFWTAPRRPRNRKFEQTPRQQPEIFRKSFVFSSLPIRKGLVSQNLLSLFLQGQKDTICVVRPGSSGRRRSTCQGHARVQRLAPSRQRESTLRWPRRVSTHLRGVLVSPAILLRLDQAGCARSSGGPHGQNIMAIAA